MGDKEWQDFMTDCKVYKEKVDNLVVTTREQEKRIIQLEKNNTKTDYQYEEIMRTLNKLVETTIPNLSKEIQEIKEKPAKRLDLIFSTVLGVVIGIVGSIITNLLLK